MSEVESRVGTPVPVVVAADDIRGGTPFEPGSLDRLLDVEEVPELFVPPDSLVAPDEALGLRAAVPIASGSYLTVGHLQSRAEPEVRGPPLAPGERVVEVAVVGGATVAAAGAGARVDVLVTTGEEAGSGRTYVALDRVELVDVRPGGSNDPSGVGASATATTIAALRVTLDQAVLLTAAQNFAREIRLLARSPADRKRVRPTTVQAADL